MDGASTLESRESENETEHLPLSIKCARSDPTDFLDDLRQGRRDDLGQVVPPNFPLKRFEGEEVLFGFEWADGYVFTCRHLAFLSLRVIHIQQKVEYAAFIVKPTSCRGEYACLSSIFRVDSYAESD